MKYLYKLEKGEVVAKLFELDETPKGWKDDPAKCKPAKKAKVDADKS